MSDKKEKIILDVAYQPQVRTGTDTRRLMLDVVISLLPAAVVAVLEFGIPPLILMVSGVASALESDDYVSFTGEHVSDLAFSFVAPVYSNYCFYHFVPPIYLMTESCVYSQTVLISQTIMIFQA